MPTRIRLVLEHGLEFQLAPARVHRRYYYLFDVFEPDFGPLNALSGLSRRPSGVPLIQY